MEPQYNLVCCIRLSDNVLFAFCGVDILAADDWGVFVEVRSVWMSHDPNLISVAMKAVWGKIAIVKKVLDHVLLSEAEGSRS